MTYEEAIELRYQANKVIQAQHQAEIHYRYLQSVAAHLAVCIQYNWPWVPLNGEDAHLRHPMRHTGARFEAQWKRAALDRRTDGRSG